MPALNLTKLEDQRRHLVLFIEKYAPQGSPNNPVTIVFDGNTEVFGGMSSPNAKIIFSQGESADDKIKKIVSLAHNKKNIVVISDDRDIQYAVRVLGAKTSSVKAFLNKAKLTGKGERPGRKNSGRIKGSLAKSNPSEPKKVIPKSDESKITSELGKIWLKPKE